MKIALDISQIIYETGVSTYTRNLCSALLDIDKENNYIFFGGSFRGYKKLRSIVNELVKGKKQVEDVILPLPPGLSDIIWNKLRLIHVEKLFGNIDVFHSSDWTQPPANAFKVTTVHDIVPLLYPKLTHPRILHVHKRRIELVKREVDRVIVPSETTKSDLKKIGFDESKIRVIPEAPDRMFSAVTKKNADNVKKKYRLHKKYLVAIGTHPRKNIDNIIDSYEKIRTEKDLRLVVVGENHGNRRFRGVEFLGHIPTLDVAAILKGSEALIYASYYEGFGLPILEAYQCSVPVVTSNLGSMKEIGEDSSVLVDPNSIDSIAEGIWEAIKDRNKYIKLGLSALKNYSWQKNAWDTLSVYKESLK